MDSAKLGWLFALFDGVVDFLIVATSPFLSMIGQQINEWIVTLGFISLIIMAIRLPADGPLRAAFSGPAILLALVYGLQPTPLQLTSGATVDATNAQKIAYTVIMTINKSLNSAIAKTMQGMSVDGNFIPADALLNYSVQRTADQYANSELGRLIRDYNEQCSPPKSMFANAADRTKVEAYHAIGLLGGAGLGIPDEERSRWAQMKIAGRGVGEIVTSVGSWSGLVVTANTLSEILDAGAVRERRAEGLAALAKADTIFVTNRPYVLPTQEHWSAIQAGKADVTPSYLTIGDAPTQVRDALVKNAVAWQPDQGGEEASQGFTIKNCVEAYHVAQFAAEQAYRALVESGGRTSVGQRTDIDAGALAAGRSWKKVQEAVYAGGADKQAGTVSTVVAGTISTWQAGKNYLKWIELQTLLPAYVAAMAGVFWLVLIIGPIAIAMSPLRGWQTIPQWLAMLAFPVFAIIFCHLIAVSASVAMSSVALAQAALSAGWQGGGTDLDLIYGSIQMLFGLLLAAGTWLATTITGVSLGGLGGAARQQVVTGADVAKAAAATATIAARGAALASKAAASPKSGGGGGGGGGSVGAKMQFSQSISSNGVQPSGRSEARYSAQFGAQLIPSRKPNIDLSQPASNSDGFALGRTPRSKKKRRPKDDE